MSNNYELEELDKTTSNTGSVAPKATESKNEVLKPKPRLLVIISAAIGLLCFFLPWFKLSVMGFMVYTVKGSDIPAWAEKIGQWSELMGGSSGSLLLLYLLYLIPILFALAIGLEIALRNRYIPLIGFLILILLIAFLVVLIYNVGISELMHLLSFGLYGSLIAGIVLVYSKK